MKVLQIKAEQWRPVLTNKYSKSKKDDKRVFKNTIVNLYKLYSILITVLLYKLTSKLIIKVSIDIDAVLIAIIHNDKTIK